MGGKGRRRREKNYRAAHGGPARLPSPPEPSQVEALPSKLRKIMSFTSIDSLYGFEKISKDQKDAGGNAEKKKKRVGNEIKLKANEVKDGSGDKHSDSEEENMRNSKNGNRNRKRKRKQLIDLRFETAMDELGKGSSKKTERKKKYFEAKKKKKQKNGKTEDPMEFPKKEKIEFGDVVEAPPKLVTIPKGSKTLLDASKERLRSQAIEAYRNRKGWTSRPGAAQPPPLTI